jgi:hypothetical protein
MAYALGPAWGEARGLIWRQRHFPVLGAFESPEELKVWTAQGGNSQTFTHLTFVREDFSHGQPLLKIETAPGDWSGVSYVAGKQDWSSCTELACDIYNNSGTFRLNVRVDDDGDCSNSALRFGREISVEKGWTHLAISVNDLKHGPKSKALNTAAITRLVFFTGEAQPARVFYLSSVVLK